MNSTPPVDDGASARVEALERKNRDLERRLAASEAQLAAWLDARPAAERLALVALSEADLRLRRLSDAGLIGVAVASRSGDILEANDTFLEIVGYDRVAIESRALRWTALVPPARLAARPVLGELQAHGSHGPSETEYLRKDGVLVPVLVGSATLDTERVITVVVDLTDRMRAEERSAAMVSTALDAVIGMDASGNITDFNPAAERTFQYSRAEVMGKSLAAAIIPVRFHAAHVAGLQRYLQGGEARIIGKRVELVAVRRDGLELPVELTVSRVGAGSSAAFMAFIRDISDQRKAESALRESEEQLRQSQKLEAIGSLAGGVAHDFNNLLSVILGYTSLLIDDLGEGDPLRADLQEIHEAGVRATALTRQLLAFSRKQMIAPVVLDLDASVANVEKMLRRLLGEDVRLVLTTSATACTVHADPGQIEQVLMNLAVNARDAMPAGGQLTIATSSVSLDANEVSKLAGLEAGPYVRLAVIDTGVGIDGAILDRIFEPFFTTKERSKGTGLGLSTVYGIVQQSGGRIFVRSAPQQGSTFEIFLPRCDRDVEASAAPSEMPALRGTETILLVEDDEQVRRVVGAILRRHGYRVLEAQNGGEAFLLCEQVAEQIHLMITDVVMPHMSGPQLAGRVLALRPQMKTLYMSGYTEDTFVRHGVSEKHVELLQKPFVPEALLERVRKVLDS